MMYDDDYRDDYDEPVEEEPVRREEPRPAYNAPQIAPRVETLEVEQPAATEVVETSPATD